MKKQGRECNRFRWIWEHSDTTHSRRQKGAEKTRIQADCWVLGTHLWIRPKTSIFTDSPLSSSGAQSFWSQNNTPKPPCRCSYRNLSALKFLAAENWSCHLHSYSRAISSLWPRSSVKWPCLRTARGRDVWWISGYYDRGDSGNINTCYLAIYLSYALTPLKVRKATF
jgi:hypothetical protein